MDVVVVLALTELKALCCGGVVDLERLLLYSCCSSHPSPFEKSKTQHKGDLVDCCCYPCGLSREIVDLVLVDLLFLGDCCWLFFLWLLCS